MDKSKFSLLSNIKYPNDLRKLSINQLPEVCHLGYLEQRVVIVFRRTEIQIHHNTPQSLNTYVLYIVFFSFANRF